MKPWLFKPHRNFEYLIINCWLCDHGLHIDGILPKGPYPPCLRMADCALLAGYPRYVMSLSWPHATNEPYTYEIDTYNTNFISFLDSKVHGANMGPTWVLSAPVGSHVGPMNLVIRVIMNCLLFCIMIYLDRVTQSTELFYSVVLWYNVNRLWHPLNGHRTCQIYFSKVCVTIPEIL